MLEALAPELPALRLNKALGALGLAGAFGAVVSDFFGRPRGCLAGASDAGGWGFEEGARASSERSRFAGLADETIVGESGAAEAFGLSQLSSEFFGAADGADGGGVATGICGDVVTSTIASVG